MLHKGVQSALTACQCCRLGLMRGHLSAAEDCHWCRDYLSMVSQSYQYPPTVGIAVVACQLPSTHCWNVMIEANTGKGSKVSHVLCQYMKRLQLASFNAFPSVGVMHACISFKSTPPPQRSSLIKPFFSNLHTRNISTAQRLYWLDHPEYKHSPGRYCSRANCCAICYWIERSFSTS